ncbi:MAG: response regulator transcription factor [Hyphomicrobiales bacterium]
MSHPIELILADPNPLMLQALSEIFERDRRFSLVATAKTAEGFLEASLRAPVPVGIIDWSLPLLGGERLLAILREAPKPPRIVVYAAPGDPGIPRRAMAAGAAGFCTRDTPPEQLLDIAAAVAGGRMVFPFLDVRGLKRDPRDDLTAREKTMLAALARGRTNTELAAELGISINTVKFHLRNLYDKLGFRNRSQAIAFYYSQGAAEGGI